MSTAVARVALICLGFAASAPRAPASDALTTDQAREEVRMVVAAIERFHPDPFHVTPKAQFYAGVETLLGSSGSVPVADHYFRLARLMSMVSDTHTQLHVTEDTPAFRSTYPLRFRIFADGLASGPGRGRGADGTGHRVGRARGRGGRDRGALGILAEHVPDPDKFVLPHSGIRVEVSQYEYVTHREADHRAYVAPDIPMALTFDDYAHGRDPILERAKAVQASEVGEFYAGTMSAFDRASQRGAAGG